MIDDTKYEKISFTRLVIDDTFDVDTRGTGVALYKQLSLQ
jgi:hypothetical protein